jgi:hypothetical protein
MAVLLVAPLFASCGSESFVLNSETPVTVPDGHWCAVTPVHSTDKPAVVPMDFVFDDAGVGRAVPNDGGIDTAHEVVRPRLLSAQPVFTKGTARGLMIARCIVTRQGRLEDCCVIRGRTDYNRALLDSLALWRYEPAVFRGNPVSIRYVIQVNVE